MRYEARQQTNDYGEPYWRVYDTVDNSWTACSGWERLVIEDDALYMNNVIAFEENTAGDGYL